MGMNPIYPVFMSLLVMLENGVDCKIDKTFNIDGKFILV